MRIIILAAVLAIGGCTSEKKMRGALGTDYSPTSWRVAGNLQGELANIDGLKSAGFMTDEEYGEARKRIIRKVTAETYISNGDYLNRQLNDLSAMQKSGQITAEEFSTIRGILVKRYVDRLGREEPSAHAP